MNTIAELAGAYSADPSAPGAVNHPLSGDVLDALAIDLGDGLQLFGPDGIVGVGAFGQYANTAPGAAPLASSGLVNADGSIAVGSGDPTENAYVDLGPILGAAGLDELLEDARLELGAISALATYDGAGDPQGDYQIANGTLLLKSPVIAALSGQIVDTLGQISDPINGIAGTGGVIDTTIDPLLSGLASTLNAALLGVGSVDNLGVTATVDLDLAAAVESVLSEPLTSDDSVLTIDLSSGTVSVDLARLVADTQGGDYDGTLNGLDVNTELLDPDVVQAGLDGAIGSTFDQIPALLVNAVTDALHAADVNIAITGEINTIVGVNIGTVDVQISGTLGDFIGAPGSTPPVTDASGTSIVGLPVGNLVTPLLSAVTGTILPALVTPLANAITDEGALDTIFRPVVEAANAVLQPLFGLVTNNLLSLTANVQEEPGDFVEETALDEGSFTQRALQLTLLPVAETPLIRLSFASATVRGDVQAITPTLDASSPVEAGGTTTVTSGGWLPNSPVELQLTDADGNPVGEPVVVTTDDEGNIPDGTTVPIPADAQPDAVFTVVGTDPDGNTAQSDTIVVDEGATDADATDADATDADATDADATDADATDADATDADATDADATDADATDADATDADATDADATDADATDADATDADATDADASDADATDADATDADATDADATDADATDADATDADATDADATDADATDADATDADATDADATDADATDADATDADATDADATDADATDADATDADATDADATDADATDADATDADATDADATDADATDADATDADATDADATDADATDADATDADATDVDATDADATDADATDADATDADATDADATDADATDGDVDAAELGISIVHPTIEREQVQSSTGTGFKPGELVTGVMNSDPVALGTQTANAAGTVTFTWTIPTGADLGAHQVTLTGAESGAVSIGFNVVAKGLATTGSEPGPAIPLALMLIAAGTLAVFGSRRMIKKAQAQS